MSDDILMMIDEEQASQKRPASAIFKSTVGLTMHDDVLCAVFSTVENRKGYGKQYVPINELQETLSILQDARDNGISAEGEIKSTSQIVQDSLIENDDGEVRFKTEATKGKKPTLCSSLEDFCGFVSALEEYTPKILAKADKVSKRINKAAGNQS